MNFNLNQIREQFPALAQYHNDKPVTFFDGPGGSQVPQSVLDSMVGYLGRFIPTWVGITSLAKLQSMSCRVRASRHKRY